MLRDSKQRKSNGGDGKWEVPGSIFDTQYPIPNTPWTPPTFTAHRPPPITPGRYRLMINEPNRSPVSNLPASDNNCQLPTTKSHEPISFPPIPPFFLWFVVGCPLAHNIQTQNPQCKSCTFFPVCRIRCHPRAPDPRPHWIINVFHLNLTSRSTGLKKSPGYFCLRQPCSLFLGSHSTGHRNLGFKKVCTTLEIKEQNSRYRLSKSGNFKRIIM